MVKTRKEFIMLTCTAVEDVYIRPRDICSLTWDKERKTTGVDLYRECQPRYIEVDETPAEIFSLCDQAAESETLA